MTNLKKQRRGMTDLKKPRRDRTNLKNLWTLIKMQLRSVVDLSFLRSKRAVILRVGLALIMFAAITAAFYVAFYVCDLISVFSYGKGIPDTVVTVLFSLIQLMSIFSCTVGLSKALYRGKDNVILLVLPVSHNIVFLSKLAVYYVSELKRNLTLTVPLFLAYGIINGAVWFYYPWMLFGFLFVSLLPVAIGAVLSIAALYIPKALSRVPVLKYILILAAAGGLIYLAFLAVGMIPENINLLGQWGSITLRIRNFLDAFARYVAPYYYLTKMLVGGMQEIASNPFSLQTLYTFLVLLGVCAILILIAFFTARVLFFKLTARASENEMKGGKARPNRVRSRAWSIFSEDLLRTARSGKALWHGLVELIVPAFLIFALNRIYAAMNTSLSGQTMTSAFNILVLLVSVLTANTFLSNAYSRDGAARNLVKTRPADFRLLLAGRLVFRAVVSTLSIIVAVALFDVGSRATAAQAVPFAIMAICANLAHILWCAEMDVMRPNAQGKNDGVAVTMAILISALFAGGFYLISDTGATSAFLKLMFAAIAFLALRSFLYFERVRIYFQEK